MEEPRHLKNGARMELALEPRHLKRRGPGGAHPGTTRQLFGNAIFSGWMILAFVLNSHISKLYL